MKRVLFAGLLSAAAALPAFAAPETYNVDPSHTIPNFEVSHFGFSTHRGRFNVTAGKIVLDMAAKSGSVEITIDTTSVDTGNEKLETHLKAEDFFNVAKFPTMAFKAGSLKFDGDNVVGAEGDLTLLGVTKPVSLKVSNFKCGAHPFNKKPLCGAEVSTTVKRSDFGMKYLVPAVSDDVKVVIQIEAYKS